MIQELRQIVGDVLDSPKTPHVAANATTGLGLMAWVNYALELMPQVISLGAAFAGLTLTVFLIKKARAETRKLNIQSELLEERDRIHKEEIKKRFESGEPCQRCTDKIE